MLGVGDLFHTKLGNLGPLDYSQTFTGYRFEHERCGQSETHWTYSLKAPVTQTNWSFTSFYRR